MVDNKFYDDLFTKEELDSAKDNLYEALGDLYNGETLKIILSESERDLSEENKVTIPGGYTEHKDLKFNTNKKSFNIIISLFINLIMELNPNIGLEEEIYALKISIITMICLTGTIGREKNFKVSETKFDKDYIMNNKGKIKDIDGKFITKVQNLFPVAVNFTSFAAINFVRFNHHFPSEKVHIISKALMGYDEKIKQELLDEEGKDTFYKNIVAPVRINNELTYYEKILNKEFSKNHDIDFKYYELLGTVPTEFKEDIINIRRVCTPNGFLILDLVKAIIDDAKARNILFLIPEIKVFAQLLKLRDYLRLNPMGYHPSRYFYKCAAEDYDKIRVEFLNLINVISGFLYCYTDIMEDSVVQAKCRMKYKNKITSYDENKVNFIKAVITQKITFDEDKVKTVKEKLNINDIIITEDLKIDEENDKAIKILNEEYDKKDFKN